MVVEIGIYQCAVEVRRFFTFMNAMGSLAKETAMQLCVGRCDLQLQIAMSCILLLFNVIIENQSINIRRWQGFG